ncbi:hypothetical protein [Vulcanisaeta souniana]|uniref:Uncharacterized protein n=1 Tax=Vulcanisaeta souniana JCM 11219 TaxID=1293586 RepID=A0A830E232_9CREN|nr:hypothetical protein [Vulcanisaeta souniana]BDR93273.1 hypothetical protein Vsou_23660 [Vulcanisaeta souniana JCM 11219]GGI78885.1 hypothetical protein GCM10007112_14730 [Vulcanisaeta souniana JCM 11219]
MQFGFRMRGLIIKVAVFLPMAVATVVSIKFVPPIFAPVIVLALLILVILLNKAINKRLAGMWGPQLFSMDNYIIYERGVYVKPIDIFYPWSEVVSMGRDQSYVTFMFNDGTEISLPRDIIDGIQGCPCTAIAR